MKKEKRAIIFSTIGLISLAIGLLLSSFPVVFGVSSPGLMIIWQLVRGIIVFAVPTPLFFLSIYAIKTLGREKSKIRTYSIAVTTLLGLGLFIKRNNHFLIGIDEQMNQYAQLAKSCAFIVYF